MNTKRTSTNIFMTVFLLLFVSKIFGQCLGNEQAFKDYYKKSISTLDPIEGIWSSNSTTKVYNQYNQLLDSKYNPQAAQWAMITDPKK